MDKKTASEDLIADPQSHFETPSDVLADQSLSFHLKQKILESWKGEANHMAESAGENMAGGEPDRLREVSQALLELNAKTEIREQ